MNSLHGYPRPQLERAEWINLNGDWEFSLDHEARWKEPDDMRRPLVLTWNLVASYPVMQTASTSYSPGASTASRFARWFRSR